MNKYLYYILKRPFLEAQWRKAHLHLGMGCSSAAYDELEAVLSQYRQKDRFHHGLAHIVHGLETIEDIGRTQKLSKRDLAVLRFAFFYHDVVYGMSNKAPNTNEVLSANQAVQYLEGKIGSNFVSRIRTLILETADHQNSTCTDELWPIMNDADLAILGTPPKVYAGYADNVWREYKVVYTRAQFVAGRMAFLNVFKTKRIFMTPQMAEWERQAILNLEHEYVRLWAESPSNRPSDASAS